MGFWKGSGAFEALTLCQSQCSSSTVGTFSSVNYATGILVVHAHTLVKQRPSHRHFLRERMHGAGINTRIFFEPVGWLKEASESLLPLFSLPVPVPVWCWCARASATRGATDAVGVAGLFSFVAPSRACRGAPVLSKVISLLARCHSTHEHPVAHGWSTCLSPSPSAFYYR